MNVIQIYLYGRIIFFISHGVKRVAIIKVSTLESSEQLITVIKY